MILTQNKQQKKIYCISLSLNVISKYQFPVLQVITADL